MADVEKYANDLIEIGSLAKEFKKGINKACGGSFEWGVEQMAESFLSMFDRFCPYEIGDRVELVKNVPVEKGKGWYCSRHFLIQGGKGTVKSRGYYKDKFSFDIEFDDESWIDDDGVERPMTNKHTYGLSESYLRTTNK